tara:strand:- start:1866 stop:5501 length:3636 start_codon:yes stop_codon:yes gene_type:complete
MTHLDPNNPLLGHDPITGDPLPQQEGFWNPSQPIGGAPVPEGDMGFAAPIIRAAGIATAPLAVRPALQVANRVAGFVPGVSSAQQAVAGAARTTLANSPRLNTAAAKAAQYIPGLGNVVNMAGRSATIPLGSGGGVMNVAGPVNRIAPLAKVASKRLLGGAGALALGGDVVNWATNKAGEGSKVETGGDFADAALKGAALGAVAGSVVGGVGAVPAAFIGAGIATSLYGISRLFGGDNDKEDGTGTQSWQTESMRAAQALADEITFPAGVHPSVASELKLHVAMAMGDQIAAKDSSSSAGFAPDQATAQNYADLLYDELRRSNGNFRQADGLARVASGVSTGAYSLELAKQTGNGAAYISELNKNDFQNKTGNSYVSAGKDDAGNSYWVGQDDKGDYHKFTPQLGEDGISTGFAPEGKVGSYSDIQILDKDYEYKGEVLAEGARQADQSDATQNRGIAANHHAAIAGIAGRDKIATEDRAESARQVDNRLNYDFTELAQQDHQFGAKLNQDDQQFFDTLANDKHQFSQNFGLNKDKFVESKSQFKQVFGEDQRQFNEDLTEGKRTFDKTFGEGQRTFDLSFGEDQRQFDLSLLQENQALQEQSRQGSAAIAAKLNEARQHTSEQMREILANPADYLARAYASRGEATPFGEVTQADLINQVTSEYNQYAKYLDSLGQGFDAELAQKEIDLRGRANAGAGGGGAAEGGAAGGAAGGIPAAGTPAAGIPTGGGGGGGGGGPVVTGPGLGSGLPGDYGLIDGALDGLEQEAYDEVPDWVIEALTPGFNPEVGGGGQPGVTPGGTTSPAPVFVDPGIVIDELGPQWTPDDPFFEDPDPNLGDISDPYNPGDGLPDPWPGTQAPIIPPWMDVDKPGDTPGNTGSLIPPVGTEGTIFPSLGHPNRGFLETLPEVVSQMQDYGGSHRNVNQPRNIHNPMTSGPNHMPAGSGGGYTANPSFTGSSPKSVQGQSPTGPGFFSGLGTGIQSLLGRGPGMEQVVEQDYTGYGSPANQRLQPKPGDNPMNTGNQSTRNFKGGGFAQRPVIVGENGAELAVPLSDGGMMVLNQDQLGFNPEMISRNRANAARYGGRYGVRRAELGGLFPPALPSTLAEMPSTVKFGNQQFGFDMSKPTTQSALQGMSTRYRSPAVRDLFAGKAANPLRFGFDLFSPGQLGRLTTDEREELRTGLATQNVALADVEQAVMRQFGGTGERRGRRTF